MKLIAYFSADDGKRLGWDENLLTNLGINHISKVDAMREELEKYLDENEKINLKTYDSSKVTIDSLEVRGIFIKEQHFNSEKIDFKVNWKQENSHLTHTGMNT